MSVKDCKWNVELEGGGVDYFVASIGEHFLNLTMEQ